MVIVPGEDFSSKGYVAPTVFLRKGGSIASWNYYATLGEALAAFIEPDPVRVAGTIYFSNNGLPQPMGINVDFYTLINNKWTPVNFEYIKNNPQTTGVIRFFDTHGDGAFYTFWNPYYFGASATVLTDYPPEKIAALDSFYREVALVKYRYNALVGFLNNLATKQLSAKEQQVFNEGLLKLQTMSNQLNTIEGLEINYSSTGAVGLPIILIIVIILILASATAWTVASIIEEKEKTKRINDSFELQKFVADKKTEVAAMVQAGTISQAQADSINKTLSEAASAGIRVADKSTEKTGSVFGEIGTLVKWGVLGFLAIEGIKLLKPSTNAK
jgi:hypothetical protein